MSATQPFAPSYGTNQVLTATSTSQTASLTPGNKQLRVVNTGSNKGYFRVFSSQNGIVSEDASVTDCPVAAGMATTVTIPEDCDKLAYISSSGTTLEVMTGEGW